MFLNAFAFSGSGVVAKFGIVHQNVEHVLEIGGVAPREGEAGSFNDLAILRNIAGEHANARRHRIKQRQGQSLEFGRKNEESGI